MSRRRSVTASTPARVACSQCAGPHHLLPPRPLRSPEPAPAGAVGGPDSHGRNAALVGGWVASTAGRVPPCVKNARTQASRVAMAGKRCAGVFALCEMKRGHSCGDAVRRTCRCARSLPCRGNPLQCISACRRSSPPLPPPLLLLGWTSKHFTSSAAASSSPLACWRSGATAGGGEPPRCNC